MVNTMDYLHPLGWEFEGKNSDGQTPLLYAAVQCTPQVARCLRAFIKNGARLDAKDKYGRGPLLSALSLPSFVSNWEDPKVLRVAPCC